MERTMAETWYPMIDLQTCTECGICVAFCTHGVYDKSKAPHPVVVNPAGCVDHCHGCGNRCPAGAITYAGEDTGWKPQAKQASDTACACDCGCSGGAEAEAEQKLLIEYLYLDLNTCDRCLGTEAVLDKVMEILHPVLVMAGYTVEYQKREMATAALAEQYRFLSSPTIRVNGRDIFGPVMESDCGCCGDIAGTAVDCRVFVYKGKTYEVPTEEMLVDAIIKSLTSPPACTCGTYELPENLKRFYEGKQEKAEGSSCSCGCCN